MNTLRTPIIHLQKLTPTENRTSSTENRTSLKNIYLNVYFFKKHISKQVLFVRKTYI